MTEANEWTMLTPTEEGYYWFYGFIWGLPSAQEDQNPRLEQVKVRRISYGLIYILEGVASYDEKKAIGFYTPMIVPTLPENIWRKK